MGVTELSCIAAHQIDALPDLVVAEGFETSNGTYTDLITQGAMGGAQGVATYNVVAGRHWCGRA